MLNNLIKECTFTGVILEEPDLLKCYDDDGNIKLLPMGKEAIEFLYDLMGVPFSMCKKLHENSPELWDKLRQQVLYENHNVKGLSKYRYCVVADEVVFAIFDGSTEDISVNYDVFDNTFSAATVNVNKAGVIQVINEKISDTGCVSLVLVDIDPIKGRYVAYEGIKTDDDCYVTFSMPIIESKSFYEFMTTFDPVVEVSMAEKYYSRTLATFTDDSLVDKELSVREVLEIIKKSKVNVVLTSDKRIASLDLADSQELVDFLNSFGMEYKSLKKLEKLKKALTYNKFSTLQLLKILSKNYKLGTNLIDSTMIATFLKPYFDQRSDRNIFEECVNEEK